MPTDDSLDTTGLLTSGGGGGWGDILLDQTEKHNAASQRATGKLTCDLHAGIKHQEKKNETVFAAVRVASSVDAINKRPFTSKTKNLLVYTRKTSSDRSSDLLPPTNFLATSLSLPGAREVPHQLRRLSLLHKQQSAAGLENASGLPRQVLCRHPPRFTVGRSAGSEAVDGHDAVHGPAAAAYFSPLLLSDEGRGHLGLDGGALHDILFS